MNPKALNGEEGETPPPDKVEPWAPETRFDCKALGCTNFVAWGCVTRQVISGESRTGDSWRGRGGRYPACRTEECAQGRAIREALAATGWDEQSHIHQSKARGRWAFLVEQRGERRNAQLAAQKRLRLVGLLEPVRTIDDEPSEKASAISPITWGDDDAE